MSLRIHNDHNRFKEIIRGRIKQNLKEYIKSGEFISKQGNDKISVSVPSVDLPRFRFGDNGGGVGQGQGKPGDKVSQGGDAQGQAAGAGSDPGNHALEVEVSLPELADMLGEELELPKVKKKSSGKLRVEKTRYTGIHTNGPDALKHFKRTFKNALRRQISMGLYDPKNPLVVPIRDDLRYRSMRVVERPESNAVIIYMMDVSGSMGEEQKEIVRCESFWVDTWLRHYYDGIEARYIIHDAMAKEVDRDTFFHTRESGGTMISSAYRLCADIIAKDYLPSEWNIYPFHFSDGDNWSVDDTRVCVGLLKERILPYCNQFSYGQVESPYGSGQFIKDLREYLPNNETIALSEIKDKEGIYQSIRDFLAHGR